MHDPVIDAKRALRADLRERRALLTEAQRETAARGIAQQLHALTERLGARSLSCYLSMTTEPGTRPFINEALTLGIRVLLPISRTDGLLDWVVATSDGTETEGLYGLPEPVGEIVGPIAVNDVDLMIVPAAAVGHDGMRMGWGRGYFDKTIGSMERCPPVYAVVFDHEVLGDVPSEVHDQPVTGVVTPERTIDFNT